MWVLRKLCELSVGEKESLKVREERALLMLVSGWRAERRCLKAEGEGGRVCLSE